MAELHWFPAYADKWLSSEAINAMLPEQEGAFFRLLCIMWRAARNAPPSLPDDDGKLAQLSRLGDRWAKLGPAIRAEFEPKGGRLTNEVLTRVWREQQQKHKKASAKARNAASIRHARSKHTPSMLQDCHSSLVLRESIDSLSSTPSDGGAGALAADAPRPAQPAERRVGRMQHIATGVARMARPRPA